ncbi:hypothetical protein MCOR17_010939, partial [Pyricularia oryzae]
IYSQHPGAHPGRLWQSRAAHLDRHWLHSRQLLRRAALPQAGHVWLCEVAYLHAACKQGDRGHQVSEPNGKGDSQ